MSVVAVSISDAIVDAMIERKHAAGGWMNWLTSFVIPDRRYYIWEGGKLDMGPSSSIFKDLECAITHCLV